MRRIDEIILHCSATPEDRHVTVETIRKWHKDRGWSDIGYHFVIYLDGSIHKGRPLSKVGAHVAGKNTGTVGVCYIGGVAKDGRTPKDTRTAAQKIAITSLIEELKADHPSIKAVSGHNQYAAKACPSFDASTVYDHLVGGRAGMTPPAAKPNERYKYLQKLLAGTGRSFGQVDGIEGKRTIAAIKDYQEFMGLPVTGEFNGATAKALRLIEKDNTPPQMQSFMGDVAATGRFSTEKAVSGVGAATTALYAANEFTDVLGDTLSGLPHWFIPVLLIGGVVAFGYMWFRRDAKQKAARELL